MVITRPSFSLSASNISAAFTIFVARSAKVVWRNSPKTRTARCSFSSSCASESGSKVFSVSPVAGLTVAIAISCASAFLFREASACLTNHDACGRRIQTPVERQERESRATNGDAQEGRRSAGIQVEPGVAENMAGTTGLEPATSAVTGQRSNQLNYVPRVGQNLVGGHGFEPRTFPGEAGRSNR